MRWVFVASAAIIVAGGCSSGASRATSHATESLATAPSIQVAAPTATTPATVATAPATTAAPHRVVPSTTTTQPAYAGLNNYTPTPRPGLRYTSATGKCTVVAGGYGVTGSVTWSDGVVETITAPGPFSVSAQRVATGSRGSTAAVTIDARGCTATITPSAG